MNSGSGILGESGSPATLSLEQRAVYQNSQAIDSLLGRCRTIAIVGLSNNLEKASFSVASYLKAKGFRILPVNPRYTEILGERAYPDLTDIPEPVDIVNIFRPQQYCLEIVEKVIAIKARAVWMQLEIVNLAAAETARQAGLTVVVDRCIRIEHGRYEGSFHK